MTLNGAMLADLGFLQWLSFLPFLPRCIVCNAVFPIANVSVRLSVRHTRIVTKRKKVPPTFLYHMKGKFIYFFEHKQWLVGDALLYLKFWVKLTHAASKRLKNGDFQSIFARSSSAVTPSGKSSIMTNGKSSTSFPMRLR